MFEPVNDLEFHLPLLPPFDRFMTYPHSMNLLCGHARNCLIWSEIGLACWHCRPDLIPVSPPRMLQPRSLPPVPVFVEEVTDDEDADMEELLCHETFLDEAEDDDDDVIFIMETPPTNLAYSKQ